MPAETLTPAEPVTVTVPPAVVPVTDLPPNTATLLASQRVAVPVVANQLLDPVVHVPDHVPVANVPEGIVPAGVQTSEGSGVAADVVPQFPPMGPLVVPVVHRPTPANPWTSGVESKVDACETIVIEVGS